MDLFSKIYAGDILPTYKAYLFLFITVILKVSIYLIPSLVVIAVICFDEGSWDLKYLKSSDFALTMIFFNVSLLTEIAGKSDCELDKDLSQFLKNICILLVIIFTVIYVFAYKEIDLAVSNNLIFGMILFSIIYGVLINIKYGFSKYYQEKKSKANQPIVIEVK